MKTKIVTIISVLLLTLALPGFSQSNAAGQADTNQIISRDIKIMEGVLDELFRIKTATGQARATFTLNNNRFGIVQSRGTWLPGYGIVFMVPDRVSAPASGNRVFAYELNGAADDSSVTVESVQNRITEFLIQYAPAMRQLGQDEFVTVIFGMEDTNSFFGDVPVIVGYALEGSSSSTAANSNDNQLPIISISARKSDIDALKQGSINESIFANRLQTSTADRNESQNHLDLNLFARILETGIENSENETFSIDGLPAYFHLDNFGAFYQLELSISPESMFQYLTNFRPLMSVNIDSSLQTATAQLRSILDEDKMEEMEQTQRDLEAAQREILIERERIRREAQERERQVQEEAEQRRQETLTNAMESLENRLTLIKELMVDYGPTLSSLDDNHSLLLSITVSGRGNEGLPERIDLRIANSDLDELQQGDITREEALSRIVERRL